MNLQRYDLDAESSSMGGYVEMRPCNVVGEWVKASEAEAEIARLRKALEAALDAVKPTFRICESCANVNDILLAEDALEVGE